MKAAVSGDIKHSKRLKVRYRELLTGVLERFFNENREFLNKPLSIHRGDFVQGEVEVKNALRFALLLKAYLNKTMLEEVKPRATAIRLDIRLSIGLGEVTLNNKKNAATSDGPAYWLSGAGIDALKKSNHTFLIACEDEFINGELVIVSQALDYLFSKWTLASAETVYELLQGKTQVQVAEKFGLSQPAINQRKSVAGWDLISRILHRYEEVLTPYLLKPNTKV